MSEVSQSPAPQEVLATESDKGKRLDVFLTEKFPAYSRVQLRRMIVGLVKVNGVGRKVAYRLEGNETVQVWLPDIPTAGPQPENIPLDIIYEDEHLIAVNKPAFMVVHPARGHWSGTLASALSFHFDKLSAAGGPTRPGIVHRLDRDTSGVMVVAKNDRIHYALAAQFEARETEKEYFAVVNGEPDRDRDWIDKPIGPHPYQRERMAIRIGHAESREATTFFEVTQRFSGFSVLKVLPKTGRTHQIRVHLAHIGNPVLCDRLYGGRAIISQGEVQHRRENATILLDRQALHAYRLSLRHPITEQPLTFEAPIPADIQKLLTELNKYRKK
jgi:23S rRNA pseudouridine1911/1915/1917 synthase